MNKPDPLMVSQSASVTVPAHLFHRADGRQKVYLRLPLIAKGNRGASGALKAAPAFDVALYRVVDRADSVNSPALVLQEGVNANDDFAQGSAAP